MSEQVQERNETMDIEIPSFLETSPIDDDFGAPEAGLFTPRIYPGPVKFLFELVPMLDKETRKPLPGGIGSMVKDGRMYVQIQYTGHVLVNELQSSRLVNPTDEETIPIRFLTASTYVFPKRGISLLAELYRTLGLHKRFGKPASVKALLEALKEASGKEHGWADLGWEAYNDDIKERISTHPNLKKGDIPWTSKDAGGRIPTSVVFSDGQEAFGRERFMSLLLPKHSSSY